MCCSCVCVFGVCVTVHASSHLGICVWVCRVCIQMCVCPQPHAGTLHGCMWVCVFPSHTTTGTRNLCFTCVMTMKTKSCAPLGSQAFIRAAGVFLVTALTVSLWRRKGALTAACWITVFHMIDLQQRQETAEERHTHTHTHTHLTSNSCKSFPEDLVRRIICCR